ncbi:hypothetical protein [Nonomuraea sp. NPDC049158]|uniref:hypothetical protein n=1 Tax=Nonomuraea sp. NPDC049158 TaxID=3155649 RepID=UPI0033F3E798
MIYGTPETPSPRSGASLKDFMQRMGHDLVRAALIYQHSTAEADRKIADVMNDKITKDANGSSEESYGAG